MRTPLSSSPTSVAVCIVTRRRPEGLRRALESLEELSLEGLRQIDLRVVVVENDHDGEARGVVESLMGGRFPIEYAAEPRHGIPFARNRALEVAGDVDFIAFLDDDEWAESQWLAELLDAREKTGAEIVVGPVLPDFAAPPPKWLRASGYFDPLSFEPLQQMGFAYTGNVLIAREAFDSGRPFPEELALTGGSDTHFFMRAWLRGVRIVWAPDARVHETIPLQRMQVGWIARREYRRGTTLSLCLLDLEPSRRRKLKRVFHGVGRIALGSALAPATVVRGRSMFVRAAKEASFGAGLLSGLTGRGYPEYRDTGPSEARR